MRFALGLGGLLVVIGVIVWIMGAPGGELDQAKSAIDARNKVDPQIKQWSGKSADGSSAKDSATFQAQFNTSGKLIGLVVTDVVSGGAYDQHFGLKTFDTIIQIGPMDLKTQDASMAEAMMVESFARNYDIVVMRANGKVTLPLPPGSVASPAPTAAATGQPTPAPTNAQPKPPKSKGLSGQLETIQQGIPAN